MQFPTTLIFSTVDDPHVQAVIPKLPKESVPLVIDFSECGTRYCSTFNISSCELLIESSTGYTFSTARLESVWWRRPQPFPFDDTMHGKDSASFVLDEHTCFWAGALAALPKHVRWYNHINSNRAAERKLYQLSQAKLCGLEIPETLATSSPRQALGFINSHSKIVYKAFWGSQAVWRPTRVFTESMRDELYRLTTCPVIFQEYIDGYEDYRVTIIDDTLESVCFDLSKTRYPYDVRIDTANPCFKKSLPAELERKLKSLMISMDLRYAAIDLRLSKSGVYYFLELNPAGQFLYLDLAAGSGIAACMARCLSAGSCEPARTGDVMATQEPNTSIEFGNFAPFPLSFPTVAHIQ